MISAFLPCRRHPMALVLLAAVPLVGTFAAAARADERARTVTFVNDSDKDIAVHVRTGSSGEVGTCEAKPSQATFQLQGKEKKSVDSEGNTVCWCSRPASEGPINERRDCAEWQRVRTGEEAHVK